MPASELLSRNLLDVRELGPGVLLRKARARVGQRTTRVRLRGVGPVWVRGVDSDVAVFRQVFGERQYSLDRFLQGALVDEAYRSILARGRTPLVVDLGANVGASALWFASRYPKATVVAVEPDVENVELCRWNTAGRNVQVVPAAIGSEPGRVALTDPSWGKWAVEVRRDDAGHVPVVTVGSIVDAHPDGELFIVKIDIEGFESDLFRSNTDWVASAKVVFVEPHDWLMPDAKSSRAFQRVMAQHDFDLLISGENLVYVRRS